MSDSSPHSVPDDFNLVRETVKRYGSKARWAALDRIENRLVALNVEKLGLVEQLEAAQRALRWISEDASTLERSRSVAREALNPASERRPMAGPPVSEYPPVMDDEPDPAKNHTQAESSDPT